VRFVQLYHTTGTDGGPVKTCKATLKVCASDQGQAREDLKGAGYRHTLVIGAANSPHTMGENRDTTGRNHIMTRLRVAGGGGVKAGAIIGQTDELASTP